MKFLIYEKLFKNFQEARCRWLTPINLATQETEIRRFTVQKPLQKKGLVLWLKR
jgi:hypothetical protein